MARSVRCLFLGMLVAYVCSLAAADLKPTIFLMMRSRLLSVRVNGAGMPLQQVRQSNS